MLYKIFDSGYYPKTKLPDVTKVAQDQQNGHNQEIPVVVPEDKTKVEDDIKKSPRANAAFITLARNNDVWEIAKSIKQVEDRFNRKFHYDWVFLNDLPFDDHFKRVIKALVSGNAKFGLIPKEHWSFPEWIDQEKAAQVRKQMVGDMAQNT